MKTRTQKFHKILVALTTLIICISPFALYGLLQVVHKSTKVDIKSKVFLEDALSGQSVKYYQGQMIFTERGQYKILNLYPFTGMSLRLGSCTEVQIKEAKLNAKQSLANLTLVIRGKHFCPNKPRIVISNDSKDVNVD